MGRSGWVTAPDYLNLDDDDDPSAPLLCRLPTKPSHSMHLAAFVHHIISPFGPCGLPSRCKFFKPESGAPDFARSRPCASFLVLHLRRIFRLTGLELLLATCPWQRSPWDRQANYNDHVELPTLDIRALTVDAIEQKQKSPMNIRDNSEPLPV